MSERTASRLKLGMIGGGPGSFIGAVHRTALALDDHFELVAGVFSSDPEKSQSQGRNWGIDPTRIYSNFEEMAHREAALPEQSRIDGVIVVTPNHLHEPAATAFLNAGIPVICDKPMAATREQAERMHALALKTKVPLIVTYNYTGYPLIQHAASMIREGKLGDIRKVVAHYHQGWLSKPIENDKHKQAAWRTDPMQAGAGALGDIGSHVENLVSVVTGLEIDSLRAEVTSMVKGRKVDDDATITLRYKGGAKGAYSVSQVCIGRENDLQLEVFGTKGSLSWRQENPNEMRHSTSDGQTLILTRGTAVQARLPAGHPEGFYEAFASIYNDAFTSIHMWKNGKSLALIAEHCSGKQGLRGVQFIDACLRSGWDNGAWVSVT